MLELPQSRLGAAYPKIRQRLPHARLPFSELASPDETQIRAKTTYGGGLKCGLSERRSSKGCHPRLKTRSPFG
jgi:hypothetical protein